MIRKLSIIEDHGINVYPLFLQKHSKWWKVGCSKSSAQFIGSHFNLAHLWFASYNSWIQTRSFGHFKVQQDCRDFRLFSEIWILTKTLFELVYHKENELKDSPAREGFWESLLKEFTPGCSLLFLLMNLIVNSMILQRILCILAKRRTDVF